ncbi:MAG: histidine triad nucleotide-binding protein [Peptoniphilaceae bacterium]|nr:histidine triad nucleotide-binding protein [Peptoniphilaceae bacterium]MDD7383504.1 histidine triad nucleotide-binding protein [Peptoniphilaceae bacterium]MDY3738677.1 histidine triad nucleotide-binding protein [Peptoniphilaceae bacterium]
MDCIFCKIANKEIQSDVIYEDEKVIAFNDNNPQAPVHFLVIPKKHIKSIDDLEEIDKDLVGHIFLVIKKITTDLGVSDNGYRVVVNTGEDAQQSVKHLHFHVMASRKFSRPAG